MSHLVESRDGFQSVIFGRFNAQAIHNFCSAWALVTFTLYWFISNIRLGLLKSKIQGLALIYVQILRVREELNMKVSTYTRKTRNDNVLMHKDVQESWSSLSVSSWAAGRRAYLLSEDAGRRTHYLYEPRENAEIIGIVVGSSVQNLGRTMVLRDGLSRNEQRKIFWLFVRTIFVIALIPFAVVHYRSTLTGSFCLYLLHQQPQFLWAGTQPLTLTYSLSISFRC